MTQGYPEFESNSNVYQEIEMKIFRFTPVVISFLILFSFSPRVLGVKNSGGLTLLEAPGARPSALGEAYTSAIDDITAFHYNPGTLPTLAYPQASFFHRQGFSKSTYSRFLLGVPQGKNSFGLSVGYFNAGEIELFDGQGSRMISGQKDLVFSLGMGRQMGQVSLGMSGKYMTSQLIESVRAQAVAVDVGTHYVINSRIRFGGSLQGLFKILGQNLNFWMLKNLSRVSLGLVRPTLL